MMRTAWIHLLDRSLICVFAWVGVFFSTEVQIGSGNTKYSFSVSLLVCSLPCCLLVDHFDCGLFASFMIQSECNLELERGSINEK